MTGRSPAGTVVWSESRTRRGGDTRRRRQASHDLHATLFRDGNTDLAGLPLHEQAGTDLVLVRHDRSVPERHAAAGQAELLEHAFPLHRLDHLAVVTHDLDVKTRFWEEVLGVPVAEEVGTR